MRKKTKKDIDYDILYVFKNVKLNIEVNEETYSLIDKEKISLIVEVLTKEIQIDKSYVDFPENKHYDTFIELEGWNQLDKDLKLTNFGKTASPKLDTLFDEAFKLIICAYIYTLLEKYDYIVEDIYLSFKENSSFKTEFFKDVYQEWKRYPGPWQDWKYN